MENTLKQLDILGCPKVEIVADSGYSAESNMVMMIKNSYPFIMHIPTDTKWTQPLIDEYRDKLMNGGEIIHCDPKFSGVTVMQIYKQLKNWIRKTSMHNILSRFDAIEETKVSGKKKSEWRTEETKRDILFVEKFGIKPRG